MVGASYKILEPDSASDAKWSIKLKDWREVRKAEFAISVWEDSRGNLWLQSGILGDLGDLVVEEYGKHYYGQFDRLDLEHFADLRVRQQFSRAFPRLGAYLDACQEAIGQVAKTNRMDLEIRFDAGHSDRIGAYAAFWIVGRTGAGASLADKLRKIEFGLFVMREALKKVGGSKWRSPVQEAKTQLKTS